jgi:hypothetical protein
VATVTSRRVERHKLVEVFKTPELVRAFESVVDDAEAARRASDELGARIGESGVATLVAGAAVVAAQQVRANSVVLLTIQVAGGVPGAVRVSSKTAGTSFSIASTSGADTSSVGWFVVNP